jgi:hypothetical protein
MSNKQTSVFGAVVVTMCVTAIGLLGGYLAVNEFLGEKPAVSAGETGDEDAASAPKRAQTRRSPSGRAGSDDVAAPTSAEAGTETAENESEPANDTVGVEEQPSEALSDDAGTAIESLAAAVEAIVAPDPDTTDARTIMEESQRRAEAKFYNYDGLLQSYNADGKTSEKRWTFDRVGSNGRSKSVLRFSSPPEVRGVALLIHNHAERASDQWMWTPALQRDRRIALQDRSTRFFGTDFSFEDLEERDVEQSEYEMLGSDTIDGAASWKIGMTPTRGRTSHYTRSIAWIRKDNYVMVRLDNFVGDEVVKRLTNSSIENIQGIWTARQLEMADLQRRTRTRLTLQQVKYNAPVNERAFTLEAIKH